MKLGHVFVFFPDSEPPISNICMSDQEFEANSDCVLFWFYLKHNQS